MRLSALIGKASKVDVLGPRPCAPALASGGARANNCVIGQRHPGHSEKAPLHKLTNSIRSGTPQVGLWVHIAHPIVAETLSQSGVGFLLVDGEHAPIPPEALLNILPATERYGMPVVYRVAWNRADLIKAALDHGVDGIMVPMVNSAAEARAAVSSAKYPPAGKRGIGAWRASNYYQNDAAYRGSANEATAVIAQIETREALHAIDEIAAVPGLDALFVGPADLALSLGVEPGQINDDLIDAVKVVAAAAARHGIASGIDVAAVEYLPTYRDLGMSLFTHGVDFGFLLDGGRAVADAFGSAPVD